MPGVPSEGAAEMDQAAAGNGVGADPVEPEGSSSAGTPSSHRSRAAVSSDEELEPSKRACSNAYATPPAGRCHASADPASGSAREAPTPRGRGGGRGSGRTA